MLTHLEVRIEGADDLRSSLSGLAGQIPFATALAINAVLNDAQAAIRATLPGEFTLRRPEFIERTIYIGPQDRARKDRLEGTLRVNPERDFLSKFEEDRAKTPTRSHTLAVPVFRSGEPARIIGRSDPLHVKKLMAAIAKGGSRGFGAGTLGVIKHRRAKGMHGPQQQELVFLIKSSKGTFLVQRTGATSTRVLYAFKPRVAISPDLHFKEIALKTAEANWERRASEAIDRAIATMR